MNKGGRRQWSNAGSSSDDQKPAQNIKTRDELLAEAYEQQRAERRALRKKLEERKKQEEEACGNVEQLEDVTLPMNRGGKKPWDDFDPESGSEDGDDGQVIEDGDAAIVQKKKQEEQARLEDLKRREDQLEEARRQAYDERKALEQKQQVPVAMVIDVENFSASAKKIQTVEDGNPSSTETDHNDDDNDHQGKDKGSRRRKRWGNPSNQDDSPVPLPLPVRTEPKEGQPALPVEAEASGKGEEDQEEDVQSPVKKVSKDEARRQAREAFRLLRERKEKIEKKLNAINQGKGKGRGPRPHPYREEKKDKAKELEAMLGKLSEMQNVVKDSLDTFSNNKPRGSSLSEEGPAEGAGLPAVEVDKNKFEPVVQSVSNDDLLYELADTFVDDAEKQLDKFISNSVSKANFKESGDDYEDEDVADMRCDLARALCIDDDDQDHSDDDPDELSSNKADAISRNMVEITKTFTEPKEDT